MIQSFSFYRLEQLNLSTWGIGLGGGRGISACLPLMPWGGGKDTSMMLVGGFPTH